MSFLRTVLYSPLCDTDKETYHKYLEASRKYYDTYTDVFGVRSRFERVAKVGGGEVSGVEAVVELLTDGGRGYREHYDQRNAVEGDGDVRCHGVFESFERSDGRELCVEAVSGVVSDPPSGRVDVGVAGESSTARECGSHGCDDSSGASVGARDSGVELNEDEVEGRGKHWASNRAKKEKKKKLRAMGRDWRMLSRGEKQQGGGGCAKVEESVAGTVRTVDTRTAVEIEAAQTLAARRIVENKVATELAKHKLRALADKSRTEAVDRLAAARYEKQINQAKAASQKSFKECDESLKSLGSTGSAGEFALKQEVKRAKEEKMLHEYTQRQLECALKYVSHEGMEAVAALPPPVFQSEYDAFGDCPSDYDDEQAESYYEELNRRQREIDDQTALCG